MSPDRNTKKQIDYVAIDMRWFSNILDVEAYLEVGGDSDHNQMIAKVHPKILMIRKKEEIPLRFYFNLCTKL